MNSHLLQEEQHQQSPLQQTQPAVPALRRSPQLWMLQHLLIPLQKSAAAMAQQELQSILQCQVQQQQEEKQLALQRHLSVRLMQQQQTMRQQQAV